MADAGGDVAAGTPAMSVTLAPLKKGTLYSLEVELSLDWTPLGEGIGTKPTKNATKRHRHVMHRLAQRVSEMAIDIGYVEFPENRPVVIPGPTGASLARQPFGDRGQEVLHHHSQWYSSRTCAGKLLGVEVKHRKEMLHQVAEVLLGTTWRCWGQ